MNCARIRLTSDRKLKPCLMRNDNLVGMITPMRNGALEGELNRLLRKHKSKGTRFQKFKD